MRKPTSQKQGMSHLHPVLSSHWVAREVAWYVHPYVTAPNYEGDYVSSRPQEFCGKMEKRGKYFRFGATGRVLPVSDFQQIGWDPWRCLCLWCMAEVFPVGSRMGMGSGLTMWKEKKETFSGKENILKKKKKGIRECRLPHHSVILSFRKGQNILDLYPLQLTFFL